MAEITTKKRNALPAQQFALPETRQYPIHDAAHVRNAVARLEQQKKAGGIGGANYRKARAAIARAAKRFGIESEYLKKNDDTGGVRTVRRRGLHMQIGMSPTGEHRLEIMHASDTGDALRLDGLELSDECTAALKSDDAPKPVWIQLAKTGTFKGHASGPFELTPVTFDEIVRNFRSTSNRRIPIDFEHASEEDGSAGSIPQEGAPAQGWIVDLDNRGRGGLWGLVEWLEPARSYIREGKYRFFSPAIRFNSRDRVTNEPIGARMSSGALTNSPFLDGMVPLAAKDHTSGATTMNTMDQTMMSANDFMPRLRAALRVHDLASPTECADKIDQLREYCGMADHPHATVMGVALGDYLTPLKGLMAMSENSTVEQILDAVEEMIEAAMAQHMVVEHGATMSTTTEEADMSDKEKELAVQLGEAKAEAKTVLAEHKTLETEHAKVTLTLKEAEAKLVSMTERATKAESEALALREQLAKRDADELDARVTVAFETYRDTKKLSEADKKGMLLVAKNDPKLFGELYPPINAGQQHLLRNVSVSREGVGDLGAARDSMRRVALSANGVTISPSRAVDAPNGFTRGEKLSLGDMKTLADKLRKNGMTNEQANSEAYAIATGAKQLPANLQ